MDSYIHNHNANDDNRSAQYNDLMPLASLREALIQISNQYLSTSIVKRAIRQCGEIDTGLEEITINEFRSVYYA